jgi:pimeloyl-ACP methyl ester carboxylesterase
MTQRCGPLAAEVTRPESEKFTSALVLVHGLWERAAAWRRFAGFLAHRGWHCIALERREGAGDVAVHVADLRAALAALDAPAVLLGHDLGANLALACGDAARAVVALTPLVAPPFAPAPSALEQAGTWLSRWRGAPLRAPGGRWSDSYPHRDVAEPPALLAQTRAGGPPLGHLATPSVVFAMDSDLVSAGDAVARMAEHVGAELHTIAGVGHAVLSDPRWESVVDATHRWIVRRLGVDLLAMYDEAMNPE